MTHRKHIVIVVTSDHIKSGIKLSPGNDPIAIALKVRGYKATVGLRHIIFGKGFYSKTPESVNKFIKRFDIGKKVKPIKFKLGVPVITVNTI